MSVEKCDKSFNFVKLILVKNLFKVKWFMFWVKQQIWVYKNQVIINSRKGKKKQFNQELLIKQKPS